MRTSTLGRAHGGDNGAIERNWERISRIWGGYEHLATKADLARVETEIAQMRAEFKADIARVETELKAGLAVVDGKVEALRGDMRGIKWWIVSAVAAIVALTGLVQALPLGG